MGPFDLAKSMDIEFGGEEHERTIASVLEAARGTGKKAAIFCGSTRPSSRVWSSSLAHTSGIDCSFLFFAGVSGEQAKRRLDQGFDMVSICTDTGSLVKEMARQVDATLGR